MKRYRLFPNKYSSSSLTLHFFNKGFRFKLFLILCLSLIITACGSPKIYQKSITSNITIDDSTRESSLPAGSTVQNALDSLGIKLGSLDKVEPPLYTSLTDGILIRVIRVREEFKTEQEVIPFFQQVLKSETIPQGETRVIQQGVNGLKELTYRLIFEDGVNTIKSPIKEPVIQPAIPEIIMVGVQTPFSPLTIPGKLAYFSTGNAWLMDGSTAIRRPLVTTGDLDGRIFALSPKADWLLFTRKSTKPAGQEINTLWVVSTETDPPVLHDLKVSNVVHFAVWVPGQPGMIAYSTVEPRNTSPIWQANNDLYTLAISSSGWTSKPKLIIDSNSGGTYGWWGTNYAWSPDGIDLAYSRPDEIGLVDLEKGVLIPLISITPYQTLKDWAWIPAITWSAGSDTLYITNHSPSVNLSDPEESQIFDLTALSVTDGTSINLVPQSGMYTFPSFSQIIEESAGADNKIAFLQAIFPEQSVTSRYRMVVMDRDGSNRQIIFPPEGFTGVTPQTNPQNIEPQAPVWAPSIATNKAEYIAVLYQGDIWLVDAQSNFSQQITGDGLIERIDWK